MNELERNIQSEPPSFGPAVKGLEGSRGRLKMLHPNPPIIVALIPNEAERRRKNYSGSQMLPSSCSQAFFIADADLVSTFQALRTR